MSSFKINIDVTKATAKLDEVGAKVKETIVKELNTFANDTLTQAKRLAPNNEGDLIKSMSMNKATLENLRSEVTVSIDYAPYIEFGTRQFAAAYVSSLPSEWQTYAAQFRGKGGGNWQDFLMRLTEWIHHRGLGSGFGGKIGVTGTFSIKTRKRTGGKDLQASQDRQAAYVIAKYIMIHGIRPHPFLFPAVRDNFKLLKERLKQD